MYFYVYRLTCHHPDATMRYYYGFRKSQQLPHEDVTYWSSSRVVAAARTLYGHEWFTKKIVSVYSNRNQALAKEIRLHHLFDVKNHPLFFNRANQTSVKFTTPSGPLSENHKQKLRQTAFRGPHSSASRQKMKQSHQGKKRKPLSKAHKQAIRQGMLKKNKAVSQETRQKMAQAKQGISRGPHAEKVKQKISQSLKLWHSFHKATSPPRK